MISPICAIYGNEVDEWTKENKNKLMDTDKQIEIIRSKKQVETIRELKVGENYR